MEDPSETAVSRDSMLENGLDVMESLSRQVRPETEGTEDRVMHSQQERIFFCFVCFFALQFPYTYLSEVQRLCNRFGNPLFRSDC